MGAEEHLNPQRIGEVVTGTNNLGFRRTLGVQFLLAGFENEEPSDAERHHATR